MASDDAPKGKSDPPNWQKPAIIAGVTLGVTLLGVTIIKKSSGKSDEELKEDVKDAANQVKATGRDVWGFTKDKAGEGGKDLKKGAKAAKSKVQGLYEEEAKPNYGILGWRHVFNNPKRGN